jgi:hypothetical protein
VLFCEHCGVDFCAAIWYNENNSRTASIHPACWPGGGRGDRDRQSRQLNFGVQESIPRMVTRPGHWGACSSNVLPCFFAVRAAVGLCHCLRTQISGRKFCAQTAPHCENWVLQQGEPN